MSFSAIPAITTIRDVVQIQLWSIAIPYHAGDDFQRPSVSPNSLIALVIGVVVVGVLRKPRSIWQHYQTGCSRGGFRKLWWYTIWEHGHLHVVTEWFKRKGHRGLYLLRWLKRRFITVCLYKDILQVRGSQCRKV
jgi:hypothetical protein